MWGAAALGTWDVAGYEGLDGAGCAASGGTGRAVGVTATCTVGLPAGDVGVAGGKLGVNVLSVEVVQGSYPGVT